MCAARRLLLTLPLAPAVCPAQTDVYTVERKIVVAGDFLNGTCWERRLACQARDKIIASNENNTDLEAIRVRWERRTSSRTASRASREEGAASRASEDAATAV